MPNGLDFMHWGERWHAGQLSSQCATRVCYRRGAESIQELPAVIGENPAEITDIEAYLAVGRLKDFIIESCLLVMNGVRITPERGDLIDETDDQGNVHTWEVMSIAGEPVQRDSGRYYHETRIHTKQVFLNA
jgi:hypothetical protein